MAEFLGPPLNPDIYTNSQGAQFLRVFPQPPIIIRTDLTTDHLRAISEWENSIWTARPKPLAETRSQFLQELEEVEEVWSNGNADLTDASTRHHLGEEIGDGIIAGIGILRSVLERDDLRIQGFLSTVLNQPTSQRRLTPESRVKYYQKNGGKLLKVLDSISSSGQFCAADKTIIINSVGSSMKAGIEAMEVLGMSPGHVVEDKTRIMKLKYSVPRVTLNGSTKGAKEDWEKRQLPVFQPNEVVLLAA